MFTNYISLGANCEAAFQFRRVLGHDSSSFFSWNVTDFSALKSLLGCNFAGILESTNLQVHGDGFMLRDLSHNYLFHSPFGNEMPVGGSDVELKLHELRSKFSYLIEKFRRQAHEGASALFYVTSDGENVKGKAAEVRDILYNFFRRDAFILVVIQDQSAQEAEWESKNLANRYVRRLAPWYDATDGHVSSWDAIFREFPHEQGLHLAGY